MQQETQSFNADPSSQEQYSDPHLSATTNTNELGKDSENSSRLPTQQELCNIVYLMRTMLCKQRSLDKAIMMMHELVVKKKPPQKVFCDYIPPLSHIPEAYKSYKYVPRNRSEIVISCEKRQKVQFESSVEEFSYKQRRQIAKCFIIQGYNRQAAQDQLIKANLKCKLQKNIYMKNISFILNQSFRRLEHFLINDCSIKIKPFTKEEMQKVIEMIIRNEVIKQSMQAFKKFIRLMFGLSNTTVQEVQTVHFYLLINKVLHNKRLSIEGLESYYENPSFQNQNSDTKSSKDPNPMQSMQKNKAIELQDIMDDQFDENEPSFWPMIDQELIQSYTSSKSIRKTTEFLQSRYKFINSLQKVKGRLFWMLKFILKRVQQQSMMQDSQFPKLQELNAQQIDKILRCSESEDLRIVLLEHYSSQEIDKSNLYFVVEMINSFCDLMQGENWKELSKQVESLRGKYEQFEGKLE